MTPTAPTMYANIAIQNAAGVLTKYAISARIANSNDTTTGGLSGASIPIFIVGAQTLQLSKSAKRAGARGSAAADFIANDGFKGIIACFAFPKMTHGVFITVF